MGALVYLLRGVLALVGGIVSRMLGARRENDNRRREIRVNALVEAWRAIERAAIRLGPAELRGLEQALAEVQLFGTPSQVEQAARVAQSMSERDDEPAQIENLLEALRGDLREEMRLGRAEVPIVYLRRREATGGLV
jgi:hypothetical protein